jgi:hypothetical protein
MDSCQRIRNETEVEVAHLDQQQLAVRWSISEVTLERWRSEGIGPTFLKLCGRPPVPATPPPQPRHCEEAQPTRQSSGGRRTGAVRLHPKGRNEAVAAEAQSKMTGGYGTS